MRFIRVHAPVHVDHPKSKRQQIHDTSHALTDIDVAVGVGINNYSHARHPGNIALNDGIIQALPAVSCIRGTERTQLVLSFITQLEVKGTRFLVESKEGSLFRLATEKEKYNTVSNRFRTKGKKKSNDGGKEFN